MKKAEKNEKIRIKLNKRFYKISAINESIKEFENVCRGRVEEDKDFFVVELESKEKAIGNILKYEFCNYVLATMKNNNLV